MDVDYNADAIDSFEKLRDKFNTFGGLKVETKDEERFYVGCKCLIQNC